MKLLRFGLLTAAVFFLLCPANSQPLSTAPFKVVGYYSLQSAMSDSATRIPFDKLTHVNLWFLNPDTAGNFTQDFSAIKPFVSAAHARGVKVLFSIGGGSAHPYYHALLSEGNRARFINNLVATVVANNLDGADVDLEGSDIDANYEAFVTELAAVLKPLNKLVTAAVAVFYKDALSDKALAQYDFVNVMSYDHTGPWRPEKPGPHSTFAQAAEDLDYFATQRRMPKERLVLGVPFYGYGFGPELTAPAISMNFADIVLRFPGAETLDEYKMPDGKILYYNGIPTIQQKTALAKEKASGVMIWQIAGDAQGKYSLLQTINEVAKEKK